MNNKYLKKIIILVVMLGIVTVVYHNLPIGMRHILNTAISSDDLYKPLVLEEYKFYEKGYTKEFILNPSYIDYYEIGIIRNKGNIPSSYKFSGKLKAEYYYKDKLIHQEVSENIKSAYYAGKSLDFLKQVSIINFEVPLAGKYKNDIRIKVTMLEPDNWLEVYKGDLNIYFSVSGIP